MDRTLLLLRALTLATGVLLVFGLFARLALLNHAPARAGRAAWRLVTGVQCVLLANYGIVWPLFLGTDAGIEVSQAYRDEFTNTVATGGGGASGERLRLMWLQNRIQFKNALVDLIEKDYQAVIVSDELNSITWDPIDLHDPFTGMARRAISIPLNGPVTRRVEHLAELAQKYRVDGAVNPCHWGCRQGTGARGLIQESLKAIGVPVVNLEVDCVDTRNFSEGQLRTRMEAFLEMLESRTAQAHCA